MPPEAADLVSRTINKGSKMQDLVDGLLELSRVQRRELEKSPSTFHKWWRSCLPNCASAFLIRPWKAAAPHCTLLR